MPIKPLKNLLDNSFKTLGKYQRGEVKQIKTNRPWFDHSGGLIPQSIITICAAAFGGKSTELENLKADIMSTDVNLQANNFVWLSNAFEMSNFVTTIRDVKKITGKSHKEVLNKEFTEEDRKKVKKYYKEKIDGRFFVNEEASTSEEFLKNTEEFLKANVDKEVCFVDMDHIALIRASAAGKKIAVDEVVEGLNRFKKIYHNLIVIILSQLNRSILGRIKDKSNEPRIVRSDLYQSDTIYHASDVVIGLQNANFLKIEEYAKINPDRYNHLEHRFTDPDGKGRVSLHTQGCIFVEVLKDRSADLNFTDLYTIEIDPEWEKPQEKLPETPKFSQPENHYKDITPVLDTSESFEEPPF